MYGLRTDVHLFQCFWYSSSFLLVIMCLVQQLATVFSFCWVNYSRNTTCALNLISTFIYTIHPAVSLSVHYLGLVYIYHPPSSQRIGTLIRLCLVWWSLTPNSTIFLLYRGGQWYWWGKPKYAKKTTDLSQVTYKLYHNITKCCTSRQNGVRTHNVLSGDRHWLHW